MITPCKDPVHSRAQRARFRHGPDSSQNDPAPGVFRRKRRLPLPGAGLRRTPVRAGRAARRGLAANRQRRARIRRLAPALAAAVGGGRLDPAPARGARGRAGRDEQLLLRGDRAPAARHRVGDRVPPGDRAGRGRRPLGAQRRRGGAGGRRRVRADGHQGTRRRPRVRAGLRQRRAVRVLHCAGPSRLAPGRYRGHRRARRGNAAGGAGRHRAGRLAGRPAPDRPGRVGRGDRSGRDLLGHPVRVRPAGDGAPHARELLADGVAAARHRDRDRPRRARADADPASTRRDRADRRGARAAPRGDGGPGRPRPHTADRGPRSRQGARLR